MDKQTTFYHSKGALARRYGVVTRTIDRWRDSGLFPAPDMVLPNGAPRWSDDTVTAHERNNVGRRKAAFAV